MEATYKGSKCKKLSCIIVSVLLVFSILNYFKREVTCKYPTVFRKHLKCIFITKLERVSICSIIKQNVSSLNV